MAKITNILYAILLITQQISFWYTVIIANMKRVTSSDGQIYVHVANSNDPFVIEVELFAKDGEKQPKIKEET